MRPAVRALAPSPSRSPAQALRKARGILPGAAAAAYSPWQDRIELLLQSTGDGIYGIDLDGRCTFVNRSAARMLGYASDALLGRHMHDTMHHTHADGRPYPECDCPILRAFRLGLPCRIDTDVLWRADGTSFPADYSSVPVVEDGVVVGAVIAFADITDRKRAEALLRRTNADLEQEVTQRTRALSDALAQVRELSAHLESVREGERARIAREIHDELGSLLVGLKLDVAWIGRRVGEDAALGGRCRAMTALVDRAVDNVGRLITDLRPSVLDNRGLWAALEWQAAEFAEVTEIECDLAFDVDPALPAPTGALANAIFRIFQEMLSNVARHARATRIDVAVGAASTGLALEVRDDGCGCPPQSLLKASAHGVLGMRERARHFGGTLCIDANTPAGTRVRLRLPWSDAA